MNENNPKRKNKRAKFLIFLAFSLEKFLTNRNEEEISPTSVIVTRGMNQNETRLRNQGIVLNMTAEI
jgi:hypothetical protein